MKLPLAVTPDELQRVRDSALPGFSVARVVFAEIDGCHAVLRLLDLELLLESLAVLRDALPEDSTDRNLARLAIDHLERLAIDHLERAQRATPTLHDLRD